MSRRQDFLNNHLAQVPFTPTQHNTILMRSETLPIVAAQDIEASDWSGNYWLSLVGSWLEHRCSLLINIKTAFSPLTFNDFELGSIAENTFSIDEEQTLKILLLSQQLNNPPVLMRSCLVGTRFANVTEYVPTNLFEYSKLLSLCTVFDKKLNHVVSFCHTDFQKLVGFVWEIKSFEFVIINFKNRCWFLHITSSYGKKGTIQWNEISKSLCNWVKEFLFERCILLSSVRKY